MRHPLPVRSDSIVDRTYGACRIYITKNVVAAPAERISAAIISLQHVTGIQQ